MNKTTTKKANRLNEITSWEAAAQLIGIDPVASLPVVSNCVERLKQFTVGMYKRAVIVEALNKAAGLEGENRWIPDFNDWSQRKYYPWGEPGKDDKLPSGFGFSDSNYGYDRTFTYVGARLSLREETLIWHMWEHFREILVDTMLIPPGEQ